MKRLIGPFCCIITRLRYHYRTIPSPLPSVTCGLLSPSLGYTSRFFPLGRIYKTWKPQLPESKDSAVGSVIAPTGYFPAQELTVACNGILYNRTVKASASVFLWALRNIG
jgi:hypothetical protein